VEGESRRGMVEHYEIRIKGHLDPRWSRWFEGMSIALLPCGETRVSGPVADQAALQGILSRIGDLGLVLLLVRQIDPADPEEEFVEDT
jgi:hypothetical protein